MRDTLRKVGIGAGLVVGGLGLLAGLSVTVGKGCTGSVLGALGHFDYDSYTGTVTEKERVPELGYRVGMKQDNGEIRAFKNVDTHVPWNWKTDSGDIQSGFKVGDHCTFDTYGFRSGYFSMFENITDVECDVVEQPAEARKTK